MQIKTLTMSGFKSFYTRTSIEFSEGITAIVGPNGCGKSNIIDAVRWVLGEQSAKQLRGDQISDIISAGNARRAPKNEAESFLTFVDTSNLLDLDRDEVEVGRRVDRDGQGTYLLNGDVVRLKDIEDLFRDTGVGQNLYSIIGQGEVRTLIDSQPEQRREIVEEAAGIASYRHRRDLTRRRLQQTRDELETVQQDLNDKQSRLNLLSGQAEKAREVQELQKKVRQYKLEEWRRRFFRLQNDINQSEQQLESLRQKQSELEEERDRIDRRRDRLEQRRESLASTLQDMEESRQRVERRYQSLREDTGRGETRSESLREQIERERRRTEEQRRRIQDTGRELIKQHQIHYRARQSRWILEIETSFLDDRHQHLKQRRKQFENKLEEIRSQTLFQINEENELSSRLQRIRSEQNQLTEQRRELDAELRRLFHRWSTSTGEWSQDRTRYVQNQTRMARRRLRHRIHQSIHEHAEDLRSGLEDKLRDLEQKQQRLSSRRDTLQSLQRTYEGYAPGVKTIMNAQDTATPDSVRGIVSNLITVPDSVGTAIRSALGERIQAILIEDRSRAVEWLRRLRNQEGGRASFLCLDALRSSDRGSRDRGLTEEEGVVGWANTMVQSETGMEPVVRYLLGDVIVVEDLDVALRLLEERSPEELPETVVTTRGDVLRPGGWIEGGSTDQHDEDLMQRSSRISSLTEQMERVQTRKQWYRSRLDGWEQWVASLGQTLDRLSARIEESRSQARELQNEIRDQRRSRRELRSRITGGVRTMVESIQELIKLRIQRTDLNIRRQYASRREDRRERETGDLKERIERMEDQIERNQELWRSRERTLQEVRTKREEERRQIKQLQQQRRELRQSRTRTLDQIRSLQQRWVREEVKRSRQAGRIRSLQDRREAWNQLMDRLKQEDARLQSRLGEVRSELREQERTNQDLENRIQKCQRELTNHRERFEECRETIEEETSVPPRTEVLEDVDTGEAETLETEELSRRRRSHQQKIRDLQPVNMLAQQQAEDLEEEVDEIRDQKDDLEQACNKLEAMIRRLNRKARTQFKEAFGEIQDYFSDFVQELFRGGSGRLELTDDPVLEAGVTLEIKPPGEKLKRLSALSGGEKALASLAFLFALFERKPTPFCFLDEVDAALDDENVGQFVRLLKRYKSDTQFVVVTHNKGTMQAASQLYGVTMEESGVSSLVRMDLEEATTLSEA